MSYKINPIALRTGFTRSWIDSWFVSKSFYPEILSYMLEIKLVIYFLSKFLEKDFMYYLDTVSLKYNNSVFVCEIYFYNGSMYEFEDLLYMKFFKYYKMVYKQLRLKLFKWKKWIFAGRLKTQKVALIGLVFNFLGNFNIDELGSRYSESKYLRLKRILWKQRKRFSPNFILKETLPFLKKFFKMISFFWNIKKMISGVYFLKNFLLHNFKYLTLMLNERSRSVEKTIFLIKRIKRKKISVKLYRSLKRKTKALYTHLKELRLKKFFYSNFMLIFMFFSFLDLYLQWNVFYAFKFPKNKDRMFSKMNLQSIMRLFLTYNVYRPFLKFFDKLLCLSYGYYGIFRVQNKFYFVDNFSISAHYIAKYWMRALLKGFRFVDLIKPVRLDLEKRMNIVNLRLYLNKRLNLGLRNRRYLYSLRVKEKVLAKHIQNTFGLHYLKVKMYTMWNCAFLDKLKFINYVKSRLICTLDEIIVNFQKLKLNCVNFLHENYLLNQNVHVFRFLVLNLKSKSKFAKYYIYKMKIKNFIYYILKYWAMFVNIRRMRRMKFIRMSRLNLWLYVLNKFFKVKVFIKPNIFWFMKRFFKKIFFYFIYTKYMRMKILNCYSFNNLQMYVDISYYFNTYFLVFYLNKVFPLKIKDFLEYKRLVILKKFTVNINPKIPVLKKMVPLIKKRDKLLYLNSQDNLLYGYKLNFLGRFTRRDRAVNAWIRIGAVPQLDMHLNIDYGFYSLPLLNSLCTVKVWLYRNDKAQVFNFRIV